MSYILDALRKSDQQRQRGTIPTLASLPETAPVAARPGLPKIVLTLVIGCALIGAGVMIGLGRLGPRPPSLAVPEPAKPVLAAPSERVALPPPAPVAVSPEAIVAPPVVMSPPSAPAALPAPSKVESGPRQEAPPISLTVHAFASNPAERLAGINGRLLREGEQIEPGFKLERITEEGVILNYKGRRIRRDMQ